MHPLLRLALTAFKFALILWLAMLVLYFTSGIPTLEAMLKTYLN